jgi:phage-related protein
VTPSRYRLRWRDYRTLAGARPVKAFLDTLTDREVAAVVAAMREVAEYGISRARHLRGDVYEVRTSADRRSLRILFSQEARFVLLALSGFMKKTAKTPPSEIELGEARLAGWRARGRQR